MYTFRSMILLHIYLKNVKIHDNVKIMLQFIDYGTEFGSTLFSRKIVTIR